jgi:hypothetical protein
VTTLDVDLLPAELVRLLAVARAEGAARPAGGRADTAAGCVTTPVRPRSSAPVPALPSRQGKGTSTAEEWPLRTERSCGVKLRWTRRLDGTGHYPGQGSTKNGDAHAA